jgi:hypothetical protein
MRDCLRVEFQGRVLAKLVQLRAELDRFGWIWIWNMLSASKSCPERQALRASRAGEGLLMCMMGEDEALKCGSSN